MEKKSTRSQNSGFHITSGGDRILNEAEWSELYDHSSTRLKPILLMASHLEMRLEEIPNLTWDKVDLQRGFITLTQRDTKNA